MSDSFRTNIWIREANTKDDGLIFKNINWISLNVDVSARNYSLG